MAMQHGDKLRNILAPRSPEVRQRKVERGLEHLRHTATGAVARVSSGSQQVPRPELSDITITSIMELDPHGHQRPLVTVAVDPLATAVSGFSGLSVRITSSGGTVKEYASESDLDGNIQTCTIRDLTTPPDATPRDYTAAVQVRSGVYGPGQWSEPKAFTITLDLTAPPNPTWPNSPVGAWITDNHYDAVYEWGTFEITWNEVAASDFSHYLLVPTRAGVLQPAIKLTETKWRKASDTPNTIWSFVVKSVDKVGNVSTGQAAPTTLTVKDAPTPVALTFPAAPNHVVFNKFDAHTRKADIRIKWNASVDPDFLSYKGWIEYGGVRQYDFETATTAVTIEDIAPGTVTTVVAYQKNKYNKGSVTVECAGVTAVDAPVPATLTWPAPPNHVTQNVYVNQDRARITVTWNAPSAADLEYLSHYRVQMWRDDTYSGEWSTNTNSFTTELVKPSDGQIQFKVYQNNIFGKGSLISAASPNVDPADRPNPAAPDLTNSDPDGTFSPETGMIVVTVGVAGAAANSSIVSYHVTLTGVAGDGDFSMSAHGGNLPFQVIPGGAWAMSVKSVDVWGQISTTPTTASGTAASLPVPPAPTLVVPLPNGDGSYGQYDPYKDRVLITCTVTVPEAIPDRIKHNTLYFTEGSTTTEYTINARGGVKQIYVTPGATFSCKAKSVNIWSVESEDSNIVSGAGQAAPPPSAPTGVTKNGTGAYQESKDRDLIIISWAPSTSPRVSNYIIRWNENGTAREQATGLVTSSPILVAPNVSIANLQVFAIRAGLESSGSTALATFTSAPRTAPTAPTNAAKTDTGTFNPAGGRADLLVTHDGSTSPRISSYVWWWSETRGGQTVLRTASVGLQLSSTLSLKPNVLVSELRVFAIREGLASVASNVIADFTSTGYPTPAAPTTTCADLDGTFNTEKSEVQLAIAVANPPTTENVIHHQVKVTSNDLTKTYALGAQGGTVIASVTPGLAWSAYTVATNYWGVASTNSAAQVSGTATGAPTPSAPTTTCADTTGTFDPLKGRTIVQITVSAPAAVQHVTTHQVRVTSNGQVLKATLGPDGGTVFFNIAPSLAWTGYAVAYNKWGVVSTNTSTQVSGTADSPPTPGTPTIALTSGYTSEGIHDSEANQTLIGITVSAPAANQYASAVTVKVSHEISDAVTIHRDYVVKATGGAVVASVTPGSAWGVYAVITNRWGVSGTNNTAQLSGTAGAGPVANIVTNGGYETAKANDATQAADWVLNTATGATGARVGHASRVKEGAYSYRVTGTTGAARVGTIKHKPIQGIPGDKYLLEVWANGNHSTSGTYFAEAELTFNPNPQGGAGPIFVLSPTAITIVQNTWTRTRRVFTWPGDGGHLLDLELKANTPSAGGGQIWFDAVSIRPMVPNERLEGKPATPTSASTDELVLGQDTRMTNARTPTGAAGGVLSGTYPNPGFASDMATQAEFDTHASRHKGDGADPIADATTFVAGLMSSADKGRLNGMADNATANTGTVTSVTMTAPSELSVAGSPVTTSGTLALTKANQSANQVWAGPTSGGAAQPEFRTLVDADLPSNPDFTGNGGITGSFAIGGGAAVQKTLAGSTSFNPPSLAPGAQASTSFGVTGAVLGDYVLPSFNLSLQGIQLTGYVSVADTVVLLFYNGTGSTVDLATGIVRALVFRT